MQSAIRFLSRWSPQLANKVYSTALVAYRSKDYTTAIENFKTLANLNYPDAQLLLIRMYRNGEGTPIDLEQAAKWTRLAADNGNAEAQYILALIYDDVAQASKDHSQVLYWYRLSAQQGFPNAQINMANCFHKGAGVQQDESLAAWWINQAAEQGDVDAQFHLGSRYVYGVGVERNQLDAFFWLDLAAKAGSEDAVASKMLITESIAHVALDLLEKDCASLNWEPKTGADSAFDIFAFAARQTIEQLRDYLGEERFASLRTLDSDTPSIGEIILRDTHGHTLPQIASNLINHLAELDRTLDGRLGASVLPEPKDTLKMIRRIDDLADVGTVRGERAAHLVNNLLEFHLSLIRDLEGSVDPETMETLRRRFSVKQGLRASRLTAHAGLHKVLLPIVPW
jgi:TPR repeat protein